MGSDPARVTEGRHHEQLLEHCGHEARVAHVLDPDRWPDNRSPCSSQAIASAAQPSTTTASSHAAATVSTSTAIPSSDVEVLELDEHMFPASYFNSKALLGIVVADNGSIGTIEVSPAAQPNQLHTCAWTDVRRVDSPPLHIVQRRRQGSYGRRQGGRRR